jgi:hypothetical protein
MHATCERVSSVKFDGDTIFALVLLVGPAAALACWYRFEWEAGFGPTSRLWRTSSVAASLLLAGLVTLTIYYGADEFRAFMGSKRSRGELPFFLLPGAALAAVIFPGPASELVGKYKELAAENATGTFSAVGWMLFAVWVFLALFGLFVRTYRS